MPRSRCRRLRSATYFCLPVLTPTYLTRVSWRRFSARSRRTPSSCPSCPWPSWLARKRPARGSLPLPLELRALRVPVCRGIPLHWATLARVPPHLGSVRLLPAVVAALRGLGVAGVCLLRQNPNGVFGSRSHIPVLP